MLWQPPLPEEYHELDETTLRERIDARRRELGDDLLILGHHYQQDAVLRHADLCGDSLKLSQMAAEQSRDRGTKFIVFCGVHFMAETADILTESRVSVSLPDLSAGCSMADMAGYDDTVDAWESIHETLGPAWNGRVIPITYVNSTAAIKAFVGEHGGACCTSSNAQQIFRWALDGGTQPVAQGEEIKLLFLPDQHLGRNTSSKFGFVTEVDVMRDRTLTPDDAETALWNPKMDDGGLDQETVRRAKVLLWAGHCSVHKLFRPEHVGEARERFAEDGGVTVLVHPECSQDVVDLADIDGSTESIIRHVSAAPPGSNWSVGTEIHLVNRLANDARARDVNVTILSDCQCLCTTMYRIEPRNLLWTLDNLATGRVVNQVTVHPRARELALLALERMLANVAIGMAPVTTARGF